MIQATEEERAAGILVDVQHRPKRRRTGRTAASAAVVVPAVEVESSAQAQAQAEAEVVVAVWTTTRRRRLAVAIVDGRPQTVLQQSRNVSFYTALHASDPAAHPLSSVSFPNRRALFEYGAQHVYADAPGTWRFEKIRTFWTHADPDTGRTRVSALVVNEVHEPRWGELLLLDTAVSRADEERVRDLLESEIPCFLTRKGQYNDIRYCGHWTFRAEREVPSFLYVTNSRPRSRALRMQPAPYDDRWGCLDVRRPLRRFVGQRRERAVDARVEVRERLVEERLGGAVVVAGKLEKVAVLTEGSHADGDARRVARVRGRGSFVEGDDERERVPGAQLGERDGREDGVEAGRRGRPR